MSDDVRHHRAKLTRAQVREIRRTLEYERISYAALARRYDVSAPTISQIANYQTWQEPASESSPAWVVDDHPETINSAIRALGQLPPDES